MQTHKIKLNTKKKASKRHKKSHINPVGIYLFKVNKRSTAWNMFKGNNKDIRTKPFILLNKEDKNSSNKEDLVL